MKGMRASGSGENIRRGQGHQEVMKHQRETRASGSDETSERDEGIREMKGLERAERMREHEEMDYGSMDRKGMDDERSAEYGDMEERLSAGREDYQRIPVPEEMRAKLEAGIRRAEAGRGEGSSENSKPADFGKPETKESRERRMDKRKIVRFRIGAAVAAAAAILVILPNTGANIAHAMGALPVVGGLFRAVTFRDYQYESDRFDASVEVPQIVVDDMTKEEAGVGAGEEEDLAGEQNAGENADKLQETVEQINFDIEKVTQQLIEEFQASADLGESYGSLEIHHETVTDNERYFTLKLSIYQGAGSGTESCKCYTIDKKTGMQVQLGDLFEENSNYNEILSENIKDQMRERMAEDEMNTYWVDYEEIPEWNFEKLKEDQNFYLDEAGNLVIAFDEYEVAPGYMGAQEFTVERRVFERILKEESL